MAISVNSNITTTSNYVIINYICDDKITKIELTKDGTNFIEAKSFNQSSATFLISDWDNGTYPNCYLRATIAEVPVIILSDINNITVNRGEEFYIRYNTNIPAVKHEFSWNNGNTYLNKTNEIITENNTNYKYLHQAETDYDNLNINIRVTDANNNTSTKSFVVTFTGSATVEYTITKNLTNCSLSNSSTSITSGSNYEAMIVCDNNYTLSSVTVTIDGIDVTNGVVSNGKISISNVEGDIIITAIATAEYTITKNLTNCLISNSSTSIKEGSAYTATITPKTGYELNNIKVTMGSTVIKNGTPDSTTSHRINISNVNGNIKISATAATVSATPDPPVIEDPPTQGLKDFPYADELIEIAMTYWRNADKEYVSGTSWSQGTTYRSANTPLSYSCEAEQDVENSFWVKKGTKHYKAIDCSTLVGMSLRGYTYENGPYANKTKFNAFRTDRNQTNPAISWAFAVPRSAAEIGEFCYNKKWIVPLDTIGNASNNFSGLKKGDLIFWAKKTDDGSYKQPDRYMKISHVAIVYGNSSTFDNRLSVIESTDNTNKVHTLSDGSTVNCGVRIKDLAHNKADQIVLVARIQV